MSLFSFLHKNKQDSVSDDSAFYSRAEEDSKAVRSRNRRTSGKAGKDAASDPVLPEKKRARRRLIGAVALVLAAIIGLPMVLDSEPKPLADDIAIQIPSKDKVSPVEQAAPAAQNVVAPASLDPKEEVMEPSLAPASPAPAETKPSPPQAAPVPQSSVHAKEAPKAAEAVTPAAKLTAKPEPKTVDRTDDGARAKAILEGKADLKATDKASGSGKFLIQVAALASKEKVDELQDKLNGAGIRSFTEKVTTASGDRTRIRVGPFPSKDEAEKVRAKIVKLGLNGTLVPA